MTANNNPLKYRRTLVSRRDPSMSCRNPNSLISVEISKTLETLGPKFQNAWNFILRVFGGALEKVVLFYAKICLNVQVSGAETPKRRESYIILWEP
jgi:hypothetical protein